MDGLKDSMEKMRLCNEKIQQENMAIRNNVNRVSTRLEEMELDNENI